MISKQALTVYRSLLNTDQWKLQSVYFANGQVATQLIREDGLLLQWHGIELFPNIPSPFTFLERVLIRSATKKFLRRTYLPRINELDL